MTHAVDRDPTRVHDRLTEAVEAHHLSVEAGVAVARPREDAEVSSLLRIATEERWMVLPRGAGIGLPSLGMGGSDERSPREPRLPDLVVGLDRMTELVDLEPDDLNATVQAGLTLRAMQEETAREGQWLALDPPGGGKITLGGVVATGVSGPLRPQFGRPRDHVLGLTLIDGRGRTLSIGGRVVKNVAGFDLVRLSVGSRGAFGIITEITFRLHPRPQEDRTLFWERSGIREAWEHGRMLATQPIPVAAAELVGGRWPDPLDGVGPRVVVRLVGSESAVRRSARLLAEKGGTPDRELSGDDSVRVSESLSEGMDGGAGSFRCHALPTLSGELVSTLEFASVERFALHLLGGTLRGTVAEADRADTLSRLSKRLDELGEAQEGPGGTARSETSGSRDSSGTDAKARLLGRLVRGFDPDGILPGTWLEGWHSGRTGVEGSVSR